MLYSYLRLKLTKKDNVKRFSFEGYKCMAYVDSVYDGDTVTIIFFFKGSVYKMSCRLIGIDTPEIKTKNPEEKKEAIISRDYLRSRILNKYKKVVFGKMDKYGRPLINIYDKKSFLNRKKSLNEEMILKNLANPYDGGKKTLFKK